MTGLNENQKRRLLIGFRHVDDLFSDIERIITAPICAQSPFPMYISDITPTQGKIISAQIAHIREEMCRILEEKGITIDHPRISAIRAVRNTIHFADIAMEKMMPKYMRGYGGLTEEAARELDEVISHMQKLLRQMVKALR